MCDLLALLRGKLSRQNPPKSEKALVFVIKVWYNIIVSILGGECSGVLFLKRSVRADKENEPQAMMFGGRRLRHEIKFLIDEGTARVLQARLLPLMAADPHGVNGGYRVTSLYFDDIYNSAYNDKLNGIDTRRKFRARTYGLDPSHITLEAKHKDGEFVSKLSAPLSAEQYAALLAGDCGFMRSHDGEEDVFGEFYRSDRLTRLRPKVIVDYRREALVYPHGNVRITFDRRLSVCYDTLDMFSRGAFYSPVFTRDIVLEIKYDSYLPAAIYAAVQGLEAPRMSVSKYIICCDKITEVKLHDF